MQVTCIVKGAAARKYPGYTYRRPIKAPIDMWQLDPERLHPAHEYPRSTNAPSAPTLQIDELADCVVGIGPRGVDGMALVQVRMRPNQFTAASVELPVCAFDVSHAFTLRHEWVDEALRRAFGAGSEEAQPDRTEES